MVRKELMSYVGSAQQLMSVRPVVYKEGRAEGLQAYEVKNDRLPIHEEEGEEKLHLLMVDDHIPAGAKLY